MRGTVKWFNAELGYGYITGEDGVEVFVHHTAIEQDGFRKLIEGEAVEYEVVSEERGLQAQKVHQL